MNMTDSVFQAVVAALTLDVDDTRLPQPKVNIASLTEFDARGQLLAIRKGDSALLQNYAGEANSDRELELEVEVIFGQEMDDGPERDARLIAAEAAFAEVLFTDVTLGGAVDELRIDGPVERAIMKARHDAVPVATIRFVLMILHTAGTPFG